jgi:hypothetical protein
LPPSGSFQGASQLSPIIVGEHASQVAHAARSVTGRGSVGVHIAAFAARPDQVAHHVVEGLAAPARGPAQGEAETAVALPHCSARDMAGSLKSHALLRNAAPGAAFLSMSPKVSTAETAGHALTGGSLGAFLAFMAVTTNDAIYSMIVTGPSPELVFGIFVGALSSLIAIGSAITGFIFCAIERS